MLVDIAAHLDTPSFPMDIFDERIQSGFRQVAERDSIPLDYIGTTALFAVSALAGNMYHTELNGSIRNIIYAMLVGPSGLGKSKAYTQICGNILKPYMSEYERDMRERRSKWNRDKEQARIDKKVFEQDEPVRRLRMGNGGTMEAIITNAMHSPAGFGLYYDEGMKMISSPNAYKKDTSSTDFWNEIWNGNPYSDLRADDKQSRFVDATSISALIGIQNDRVDRVLTPEAITSGLASRFLMTVSDIIPLNEEIDHFKKKEALLDAWWEETVISLYQMGNTYDHNSLPITIPFTSPAKSAFNELSRKLTKQSNFNRLNYKVGDVSQIMMAYDSKLYQYVGRFLSVLAIMDNYRAPKITEQVVHNAELLYNFYRQQAEKLFNRLNIEGGSGMTMQEKKLYDLLPDTFSSSQAKDMCCTLKLSLSFFDMAYIRKYRLGFLKKTGRGMYQKI